MIEIAPHPETGVRQAMAQRVFTPDEIARNTNAKTMQAFRAAVRGLLMLTLDEFAKTHGIRLSAPRFIDLPPPHRPDDPPGMAALAHEVF
jgi:hypothetical protein